MAKYERRVLTDKEWEKFLIATLGTPDPTNGTWEPDLYDESGFYRDALDEMAHLRNLKIPVIPDLDAQILERITRNPVSFDMGAWHGETYDYDENDREICQTTHCRAGWADVIAFPRGWKARKDEDAFFTASEETRNIGAMVYLVATGKIPDFFTSNETALRSIRRAARYQTTGK